MRCCPDTRFEGSFLCDGLKGRLTAVQTRHPQRYVVPIQLSRRAMLRLLAAGTGVALLRLPHAAGARAGTVPVTSPPHGFLTSDELAILDAATARIIPTDAQVGARECGVIDYIQSMLTYMPGTDANCDRHVNAADVTATVLAAHGPRAGCADGGDVNGDGVVNAGDAVASESAVYQARPVFAGGPFSGRQPQPHFPTGTTACRVCHVAPLPQAAASAAGTGSTVDNYPPDFFLEHLPLPRLQRLSWKIRILGADAVPEAQKNPLATELLETDMRRKYRTGLAEIDSISLSTAGLGFVRLTPQQQSTVLGKADPDFVTLLTYHTIEGMLCAPEYGGNHDRLGWQLIGFDGDSQPLGYEIPDDTAPGDYRERPEKPNSGPNPDEDCHGFSEKVNTFLSVVTRAELTQPGQRFPAPYCFEVPE